MLPLQIIDAAQHEMERKRSRRFGREWLKDALGNIVKCTGEELTLTQFVSTLHNLARKANEKAILDLGPRPLKESDAALVDNCRLLEADGSDSADAAAARVDAGALAEADPRPSAWDGLLRLLRTVASPRERELLVQIELQRERGEWDWERVSKGGFPWNLAAAGRKIGIAPADARKYWQRLKVKARKAPQKQLTAA